MNQNHSSQHLLILVGSPRRDGNSAALGAAAQRGADAAGLSTKLLFLDDYIQGFLSDLRTKPVPDDRYSELFLEHFLPADGVLICTPIYWYGMSAQTKAFFDRSFSHYAGTGPEPERVKACMTGKRLGLAVASEETYPGAALGIVHQVQEFARYTHSDFVGYVHGAGNQRGEIAQDPRQPLRAAEQLGASFFTRKYSDYRIETPRAHNVWAAAGSDAPA
ncbi:flavodoxin family protein [Achromobacter piechaudii]|uniref:NAD(P)H-dependent FMN-containing oxidoreductase YwqN n=1 Tax=Achromobacter piechaudii TaxID=72556 RepID=A0A6S7ELP1_9BURK|nr:NAD(P)H-dependent oxidoreductase [Achromobacter piechaudii]CAB3917967.1 Putative NAD(P)H-dependent FMN-containing oxidoreductase YwqN [Achromobacter piechaudii]